MKLLIITQKVDKNDSTLGFFHRWLIEFAKHFERVLVICLEEGKHDLPANVRVYSLGKEKSSSRLLYILRFYKYIFLLRKEYNAVFVHMNPEYIVLGGKFWRLWGKKIGLWYTHRQTNLKLWIAEKFANVVFTAAKESFTQKSNKLKILGHGIDVESFKCPPYAKHRGPVKLLMVGRITPIKHCESAIEAVALLKDSWQRDVSLRLIGAPNVFSDKAYLERLKKLAETFQVSEKIEFVGNMPNKNIAKEYCGADATLNLTPTGGIDKAVLESMAAGRVAFSSNRAFSDYFSPWSDKLLLRDNSPRTVADGIKRVFEEVNVEAVAASLKETAKRKASVEALVSNIASEMR